MIISGYFVSGHWWLLMVIDVYYINVIGEHSIGGYFINGYWWLFYCKPLVIILLATIDGYQCLFY